MAHWLFVVLLAMLPLQADRRQDDDKIYRLVLAEIIQPEVNRFSAAAKLAVPAPVMVVDETVPMCSSDPRSKDLICISPDSHLASFEGSSRVSKLAFAGLIGEEVRRELSESLRARNAGTLAFPPAAIANVIPVPADQLDAAWKREAARTRGVARFSAPAYSRDGHAVVYASYMCGQPCGYGWLVLLKKAGDQWTLVLAQGIWIA
jgi:hypothetical protein